jgi:VCBS repeat-containing protein
MTYRATVKDGTAYGISFHNYAQILSSENDANPADNASSATTLVTFNRPPVANDDFYSVNEDAVLSVSAPGVLANDTDADGNPLTVATPRPICPPVNGSLLFNPEGSFSYTPNANFNGVDSFTYHVTDGSVTSAVAIVTITVVPVNDPPVAAADSYSTDEDTALTMAAPGVLANDMDADFDSLVAALVTGPSHGVLFLNTDGSFLYTPALNYSGPDGFTYRASDGSAESGVTTVSIVVRPVNDAPVAEADAHATDEDTALSISAPGVLANDADVDGDALTASVASGPAHGTLTLNANGSFLYTPSANYNGPDSFTYKVSDGSVDSAPALVSITVRPINDIPVVTDDTYSTDEDTALNISVPGVLGNDTDVDGDALTAMLVADAAHGTLTFNPNGSFAYTPAANYNGPDSFTYRAADGVAQSAIATVSITVRPINDAPVVANDTYATDEDMPLNISTPGVLANDSDMEGDALTAQLVNGPAHGSLTLNPNGSFAYAPTGDYHGPDSFTYRANDGLADSSIATVSITVRPVNDAPAAANDADATDEDTPLNISTPGVLANDTDVDGDPLTAALLLVLSGAALNASGSFAYAEANYNGAAASPTGRTTVWRTRASRRSTSSSSHQRRSRDRERRLCHR